MPNTQETQQVSERDIRGVANDVDGLSVENSERNSHRGNLPKQLSDSIVGLRGGARK